MAIDEQHIALPQLYGAPAYARPVPPIDHTPRPFDTDDLPIEAVMTPEERTIAESMPGHPYAPAGAHVAHPATPAGRRLQLLPRPLSLRALAGRVLGNGES